MIRDIAAAVFLAPVIGAVFIFVYALIIVIHEVAKAVINHLKRED